MNRRIAVVLFNLGGPDNLDAVGPFLMNLFNDRAIIRLPQPFRWLVAKLISSRRENTAREIYQKMGGSSPLLSQTVAQQSSLQASLEIKLPDDQVEVVVAMRYWKPFTASAAAAVEAFSPDEVILLPLYPQYSKTTTGSSLGTWARAYKGAGRVHSVCCYPEQTDLIAAHAVKIRQISPKGDVSGFRIVFSAHGIPKNMVEGGDPYQNQIERSAEAVARHLGVIDWRISYQSRVGPLEWIGPSTEETIKQAGEDGVSLIVAPIAFVSEHSETLVELDIDYRDLAKSAGVPVYLRAPALGVDPHYMRALADMVVQSLSKQGVCPAGRPCPDRFVECPFQQRTAA